MLLDLAPGADLQTAAHPTQGLFRWTGGSPLRRPSISRPSSDDPSKWRSFACSNSSAGTTGSGFGGAFRLITIPQLLSLWQISPAGNNPIEGSLCRFRYLDHYCDIQGRPASRASLSGLDSCVLAPQVDFRWNRVGADWAVGLTLGVTFNECFHGSSSLHRTQNHMHGLCQFRKDS